MQIGNDYRFLWPKNKGEQNNVKIWKIGNWIYKTPMAQDIIVISGLFLYLTRIRVLIMSQIQRCSIYVELIHFSLGCTQLEPYPFPKLVFSSNSALILFSCEYRIGEMLIAIKEMDKDTRTRNLIGTTYFPCIFNQLKQKLRTERQIFAEILLEQSQTSSKTKDSRQKQEKKGIHQVFKLANRKMSLITWRKYLLIIKIHHNPTLPYQPFVQTIWTITNGRISRSYFHE